MRPEILDCSVDDTALAEAEVDDVGGVEDRSLFFRSDSSPPQSAEVDGDDFLSQNIGVDSMKSLY